MKPEKINGFNRKPHLFQITSYIFFFGIAASYFFILFPLSSNTSKVISCILEVISGAVVFISTYIATATDPSDPHLKASIKARFAKCTYEPTIREFYCSADHTYVSATSKHCRRCNRCTEGFDHHCKWINNDVGKANYKSFFVMISSVLVFLTVYLIFGMLATVAYANDSTLSGHDIFLYDNESNQILAVMAILWIFMALSAAFLVLDGNLVLFHIFLMYKGLTTFQYITAVEERKEYKKEMEYAMKILGENRKTCLDFILCLKKKEARAEHNKSVLPKETPQGLVQEMGDLNSVDKKKNDDLYDDKRSPTKSGSKAGMDDTRNEEHFDALVKEKNLFRDIPSADDPNIQSPTPTPHKDTHELVPHKNNMEAHQKNYLTETDDQVQGAKPVIIQIASEQVKKVLEQNNKGETSNKDIKRMLDEISNEYIMDSYDPEIGKTQRTPQGKTSDKILNKKKSSTKVSGEIDQDGSIRHKVKKDVHWNNQRSLAYSVEKEKGDSPHIHSNLNTGRSNHTPHLTEIKKNNLMLEDCYAIKIHESEIRDERDDHRGKMKVHTDIAVESFRESSKEVDVKV